MPQRALMASRIGGPLCDEPVDRSSTAPERPTPRRNARSARRFLLVGLASVVGLLSVSSPASAESYVVRRGDTLSGVAKQHGLTVADLQTANNLTDPDRLVAGRTLVIPPLVHVVQPGEALSTIARRYGTTTSALAEANSITNPDRVRAGQSLRIRGATAAAAPAPAPVAPPPAPSTTSHVIKPGEALSVLARRLGTTTTELLRLNRLPNPDHIRAGDVLIVPASGAAGAAGGATAVGRSASAAAPTDRYRNLPSRLRSRPERLALVPAFEQWAGVYGLPVELLMAVAWRESGWQTAAVSSKGALGIGQLMPTTATWVASRIIGVPSLDPKVPEHNIRMSAAYLSWLERYMGGRDLAIAAYFQGPTSVRTMGVLPVSEAYLAGVRGLLGTFRPS